MSGKRLFPRIVREAITPSYVRLTHCRISCHTVNWECDTLWPLHTARVHLIYCQLQMHLFQGFIWNTNSPTSATSQSLAEAAGSCASYPVPDPVAALSVCMQAVASNTDILENSLHHLRQNTYEIMDDSPASIRAATMTGLMIITIGIHRQIPGFLGELFPPHGGSEAIVAQINKKHAVAADVLSEEKRRLNVCIEYLTALKDRFVFPMIPGFVFI